MLLHVALYILVTCKHRASVYNQFFPRDKASFLTCQKDYSLSDLLGHPPSKQRDRFVHIFGIHPVLDLEFHNFDCKPRITAAYLRMGQTYEGSQYRLDKLNLHECRLYHMLQHLSAICQERQSSQQHTK
jgi:hypothetical protein